MIEVSPVIIAKDRRNELMGSLMLFFTGFSRFAFTIAEKTINNMDENENILHAIGALVDDAETILQGRQDPTAELGKLLHQSWMMKRELAEGVTTPALDEIYEAGIEAGAIGGKILGAGGGGFMLFVVKPEAQAAVRHRLNKLIHVNFDIDLGGSKIVVFEPDGFAYA